MRESARLNQTIGSFLAYARPQRFAVTGSMSGSSCRTRRCAAHSAEVRAPTSWTWTSESPVWCEADEDNCARSSGISRPTAAGHAGGGRLRSAPGRTGRSRGVLIVQDEAWDTEAELDAIFQPFHGTFARAAASGWRSSPHCQRLRR